MSKTVKYQTARERGLTHFYWWQYGKSWRHGQWIGHDIKGESSDRAIWSGSKVALWLAQKTGREQVGKLLGWEYLKKCGYTTSPKICYNRTQARKDDCMKVHYQERIEDTVTESGRVTKRSIN